MLNHSNHSIEKVLLNINQSSPVSIHRRKISVEIDFLNYAMLIQIITLIIKYAVFFSRTDESYPKQNFWPSVTVGTRPLALSPKKLKVLHFDEFLLLDYLKNIFLNIIWNWDKVISWYPCLAWVRCTPSSRRPGRTSAWCRRRRWQRTEARLQSGTQLEECREPSKVWPSKVWRKIDRRLEKILLKNVLSTIVDLYVFTK